MFHPPANGLERRIRTNEHLHRVATRSNFSQRNCLSKISFADDHYSNAKIFRFDRDGLLLLPRLSRMRYYPVLVRLALLRPARRRHAKLKLEHYPLHCNTADSRSSVKLPALPPIYACNTSLMGPFLLTSTWSNSSPEEHRLRSAVMLWLTNNTVRPTLDILSFFLCIVFGIRYLLLQVLRQRTECPGRDGRQPQS